MSEPPIEVVAGIVRQGSGRVLLAQRPPGTHLAGLWEFPGGKIAVGETPFQALVRELQEELGIQVHQAQPLLRVAHAYPDKCIGLHAWTVGDWSGTPTGLEGQALAWHCITELDRIAMPAADRPVSTALHLPAHYAISPEPDPSDVPGFRRSLDQLLAHPDRLVQLRCKQMPDAAYAALARHAAQHAERHGGQMLLNDAPELAAELGTGLHLPSARLRAWATEEGDQGDGRACWLAAKRTNWLAASCHDADELRLAQRIGCDFVTLGPVHATASHPDALPLGWDRLAALTAQAGVPVFGLGGVTARDLDTARNHGIFGIAGIRAFWPTG